MYGPAPRLAPALLLGLLAACDIPTEMPKWNTTWLLPGEDTSISVESLLPGSVGVLPGGSAFQLNLTPVGFSQTLGQMCPPCAVFDNLVVPKPAFTTDFGADVILPSEVASAALASGQVQVALSHTFSFDPLRPSASARGYLVLTASTGGTVLARDSIPGETTALPPGAQLDRTLVLSAASVAGPITISVRLHSPAGDPVVINSNQGLSVHAAPVDVRITQARVILANSDISTDPTEIDLEELDDEIADRIHGGAIRLEIDNPFTVSGAIEVRITRPGLTPLVRSIQIQPGTGTSRVEFSGDELRSLIGRSGVTLQLRGAVSSAAGGTLVTPTSEIGIRTRLELTVGPKGN